MSELVFIVGNQTKTTSLKVAEYFGKRHSDVLEAIRALDCTSEFSQRNFTSANYIDSQAKARPYYEMTKDGFTFLVMGFRGIKAAKLKESYIQAFNAMEANIKQQPQAGSLDFLQGMLDAMKNQAERITDIANSQAQLIKRVERVEAQPKPGLHLTISHAKDFKTVRKEQLLEEYRRPIADLVLTVFSHITGYAERWRAARAQYYSDTGEHFPHVGKANETQLREFLRWLNNYKY
jgi:Rha family phage regulatory protein